MSGPIKDDFVARPAMHAIGNFITHGARRQIDSLLFAQKISDTLTKCRHRGIKVGLFVTNFRLSHETAHTVTWLGSCITVKVDQAGTFASLAASAEDLSALFST